MNNSLSGKKILIALPVLNMGGTEIHTLLLARAIASAGGDVSVCCYHEYSDEVVKWFVELGVDVHLLNIPRSLSGMSFSELKNVYTSFSQIIKKTQPDVIHVQYVAPGLVPIIAARQQSSAVITAAVHTSGGYVYGNKARLMIKTAARLCDAFVCVSDDVKSFWFGTNAVNTISTIYNGVDSDEIGKEIGKVEKAKIKRQFSLSGDPLFVIVGRAGKHKGHDLLFNAAACLTDKLPEARVAVIGKVLEKDFLENLAAELHIESKISWLGLLSRRQLLHVMSVADCLVIPSRYEGFGLTAIEAMSVGVPVIATAVGGLPEIIRHETTGLLVQTDDHIGLSEAMVRMAGDENLRQRCIIEGKKTVREKFSFERFALQWIDLFKQHAGESK